MQIPSDDCIAPVLAKHLLPGHSLMAYSATTWISNSLLIALAILPALLISWYIYRLDKHEKEPRAPLTIAFGTGLAAAWIAIRAETGAAAFIPELPELLRALVFSFLVVALIEESIKWFFLIAYPYRQTFFNEPFDGIIYAVMIAMGMATFENILYANRYDLATILLRAFTAVPAHGLFAVIMGYYVGKARFSSTGRRRLLAKGWLLALSLHGAYDFFLLQKAYKELVILAALTLAFCFYLAQRLLAEHQEAPPFTGDGD